MIEEYILNTTNYIHRLRNVEKVFYAEEHVMPKLNWLIRATNNVNRLTEEIERKWTQASKEDAEYRLKLAIARQESIIDELVPLVNDLKTKKMELLEGIPIYILSDDDSTSEY
jgi:hypothetical protein